MSDNAAPESTNASASAEAEVPAATNSAFTVEGQPIASTDIQRLSRALMRTPQGHTTGWSFSKTPEGIHGELVVHNFAKNIEDLASWPVETCRALMKLILVEVDHRELKKEGQATVLKDFSMEELDSLEHHLGLRANGKEGIHYVVSQTFT